MEKNELSPGASVLSIIGVVRRYLSVSLTIFLISMASGILYATTIKSSYRAQVLLGPPTEHDVKALILGSLSISRSKTPEIYDLTTVPEIFQAFKTNLASRANQQTFLDLYAEKYFGRPLSPQFVDTSADGFNKKVPGSNFAALTVDWHMVDAQSNRLPGFLPRLIQNQFYPILTIRVDSDKQSSRTDLLLSIDWADPKVAANIANDFVDFIQKKTVGQILDLVSTGNDLVRESLENYLQQKRRVAAKQIQSRAKDLERAIKIARALNIVDPTSAFGNYNVISITPPPSFFIHPNSSPQPFPNKKPTQFLPLFNPANVSVEATSPVNSYSPPLYARGFRALELELDLLVTEGSPDHYIENIHSLVEAIKWLDSNKIDPAQINAAAIIRSSTPPTHSFGLTFSAVLFVFALIGIVLVILVSILLYFFDLTRPERSSLR